MIDTKDLTQGLSQLNGYDYEDAERQLRLLGDNSPEPTFSKRFQAILAAKALHIVPDEIRALPMREYASVTLQVFDFLLSGTDGAARSQLTDASQSPSENTPPSPTGSAKHRSS